MMSRSESGKKSRNVSGNGKLINEIDAINKGLYSEKNPTRSSAAASSSSSYYGATGRGKSTGRLDRPDSIPKPKYRGIGGGHAESSGKDKKSSFWSKTLKSLSKPRSRRFNLCFSLQVHKIKALPSAFNGRSLVVHWKWEDGGLVTSPAKVSQCVAEFEEQLFHTCTVHGTSSSGVRHSSKYEAKHFSVYACQDRRVEIDLGRHHDVDLTRLLPLTFEELEGEKSSGKWSTTYRLQGEAAGATMSVSFGYVLIGDNPFMPPNNRIVLELLSTKQINPTPQSLPQPLYDRVLHQVLPAAGTGLSESLMKLDMMFQEESAVPVDQSEPGQTSFSQADDFEQDVVCGNSDDKHLESSVEEKAPCNGDAAATDDIEPSLAGGSNIQESVIYDDNCVEKGGCSKESILEEIESALNDVVDLEKAALDTPEAESEPGVRKKYVDGKSSDVEVPVYIDDDIESAENEFLNLLGVDDTPTDFISEDEPESPRERLLREFEREIEFSGYSLFRSSFSEEEEEEEEEEYKYDAPRVPEWENLSENSELPSTVELGEEYCIENFADVFDLESVSQVIEDHEFEGEGSGWRPRAKVLEDLETEELMRVCGLNEKTFESFQADYTESPSELTHQNPLMLPDLGEGLGPFVQTKNGGFLRSMNPSLFMNSKSGGRLIMQVSSPVVVPADMGSEVMDVLENLASIGMERLSAQANKLMPLEDISGKSMQQFAWEAAPQLETNNRQDLVQHESDSGTAASVGRKKSKKRSSRPKPHTSSSSSRSEYVNLEELAPLAMDKIEAVTMEGLKIQCGMSEEEAPSNIIPKSVGAEGAVGLQLLDVRHDGAAAVDGLMGLSLTLDEWMRMDSGEIDEDEMSNERTTKILAAHHARSGPPAAARRGGLFGNTFTVALMVQLRDPLRDYEPVGTPMLALIQVERVFLPPKPKVYSSVSDPKKNDDDDDEDDAAQKQVEGKMGRTEEELIPQYTVGDVHVAGLNLKSQVVRKNKLWGSASQEQSGSRWLLANGMGKPNNKQPFLRTKAAAAAKPSSSKQATAIAQSGDTLWSISTKIHGSGSKWKELASLNPHFRNPNLVIPAGTVIRI